MTPKRAILVGLGSYGRQWASDCRDHEGVDLVGFVAHSERSYERAAREWGVPQDRLFMNLKEAIERTRPDFALDVTPPSAHREVALTCFAAGVSVLGAKPLSDDADAAREMVKAGKEAGCCHMVAQVARFAALPRMTRRLLDEDRIGDPAQLDAALFAAWADWPGTHYVNDPYMFLIDMGCHHFDTMRYLLDKDPVSTQVISWNLPWGWHKGDASHVAVFEFPGCRAVHRGVGCSNGKANWPGYWRIEGPKGSITWEEGRLFVGREHGLATPECEEIDLSGYDRPTGRIAALEEFIRAMNEDREPECSGMDNLGTIMMTLAAAQSAREGRRVMINRM
jgi:predicted dehydrogenase